MIVEAQANHATRLGLSKMGLTVIPDSLSLLTQLQALDISGNQLTSLPDWLCQLTQLDHAGSSAFARSESRVPSTNPRSISGVSFCEYLYYHPHD